MAMSHITQDVAHGMAKALLEGSMTRDMLCQEHGMTRAELSHVWRKFKLTEVVAHVKRSGKSEKAELHQFQSDPNNAEDFEKAVARCKAGESVAAVVRAFPNIKYMALYNRIKREKQDQAKKAKAQEVIQTYLRSDRNVGHEGIVFPK